ncbi:MAG: PAS domain S-box protein [bacterium]|nr:PAS domain S-box protein [bacterium]
MAKTLDREDSSAAVGRITVGSITHRGILECSQDTTLRAAACKMYDARCSSIIVVSAGEPVGIWTEKDALGTTFDNSQGFDIGISEVMSSPVRTIPADAQLEEAGALFGRLGIRHLLVIDDDGRPMGAISQTDILLRSNAEYFFLVSNVGSIMERQYVSVNGDSPFSEALATMNRASKATILVNAVGDEGPGIITERDVMRLIAHGQTSCTAMEAASRPLITVPHDTSLTSARDFMERKGIRHLAVTGHRGDVIGLLSFSDFLLSIHYNYFQHLETELERRTRGLLESEEKFRSIYESSKVSMIVAVDDNGDIVQWNPGAERSFGFSEKEVVGQPLLRLIPERYRKAHTAGFQRARDTGKYRIMAKALELHALHKDGHEFPIELSLGTWDVGGKRYFSAIINDITKRKEAEHGLRESETRFRAFVESSPNPISMKDREGRYSLINQNFAKLAGLPPEKILGKTSYGVLAEPHAASDVQHDRQVIEKRSSALREESIETVDGMRTLLVNKFPVFDETEDVAAVGTIYTDITERMQTEEQLRQSQRMEAVGQLTGGIAHDFNNVLAVILGDLEVIQEDLGRSNPLHAILESTIEATMRGAELTHRLLAFARKQTLDVMSVDLSSLVQGMNSMLRRSLGGTIDIEVASDADLWLCAADPAQMEHAVLNLAINARDAMPDGGKLKIEASNVHLTAEDAASHGDLVPGRYVMLAVSDTGTGMPPEVRRQIFEPYFTTKGPGKGTGLGLSMVFGFVNQSKGHISVDSEEGHGTTFKLYLPKSDESMTDISTSNATESPLAAQPGETVLVVEDDKDVGASVTRMLTLLGYTVLEAVDGKEALRILANTSRVDLLLTDVILPGEMRGRILREAALEEKSDLKVLFMSGYADDAIARHGQLDPGVEFLPKPFTKGDLARSVRKVLDD